MEGKLNGFERGFHRLALWLVVKIQFQAFQTIHKCKIPQAWKMPNVVGGCHPLSPKIRHSKFLFSIQVFKSAMKLLSPGQKISLLVSLVRFLNLLRVNGKKSYPESEPYEIFLRIIFKSCYACIYRVCVYVYMHIYLHACSFFCHLTYLQKSVVAVI